MERNKNFAEIQSGFWCLRQFWNWFANGFEFDIFIYKNNTY